MRIEGFVETMNGSQTEDYSGYANIESAPNLCDNVSQITSSRSH